MVLFRTNLGGGLGLGDCVEFDYKLAGWAKLWEEDLVSRSSIRCLHMSRVDLEEAERDLCHLSHRRSLGTAGALGLSDDLPGLVAAPDDDSVDL